VGIITESDIFEILVETLGVREGGTRLTLELPQRPGVLHEVTGVIRKYEVEYSQFSYFLPATEIRLPLCGYAISYPGTRKNHWRVKPKSRRQCVPRMGDSRGGIIFVFSLLRK